jgi:hypothetical protein
MFQPEVVAGGGPWDEHKRDGMSEEDNFFKHLGQHAVGRMWGRKIYARYCTARWSRVPNEAHRPHTHTDMGVVMRRPDKARGWFLHPEA